MVQRDARGERDRAVQAERAKWKKAEDDSTIEWDKKKTSERRAAHILEVEQQHTVPKSADLIREDLALARLWDQPANPTRITLKRWAVDYAGCRITDTELHSEILRIHGAIESLVKPA